MLKEDLSVSKDDDGIPPLWLPNVNILILLTVGERLAIWTTL